jgi:hypothetical protein
MMTPEEKREYDRVRMAKWLKNHPEARERNRLKNIVWRANNREKCCLSTANWRVRNPDYESNRKLKERYGITPEKYTELLVVQEGRCAICGNKETARHNRSNEIQKLAVDHCHVTGKVRGLLCQDCNRGISKFHEDTKRLENAIKYLTYPS